jgi:transposase
VFLKRNVTTIKGKTYENFCLVESVSTPRGPRHKVICSLGHLEPGPREHWLALAHKLESSLSGQTSLVLEPETAQLIERVRELAKKSPPLRSASGEDVQRVRVDLVTTTDARPAGAIHVGHQMWKRLGIDQVLADVGLPEKTRTLSEAMVLNRLIRPASEHAMPDWMAHTAISDVLGLQTRQLSDTALYRNLDRLHPKRAMVDAALAARERDLFELDDTIWLYDLTSTYFEGACPINPQAERGYSRDSRPDCKQVVVGLVVNREGFPVAHEIFDGSRTDCTTVDAMLEKLEGRRATRGPATVVVDRGMAFDENLAQIKARHHHYLVAARQGERLEYAEDFTNEVGWEEVIREPSPTNPFQKKSRVWIKKKLEGEELLVLCRSEGRQEKDRAIREKHDQRLREALARLSARVANGRLRQEKKIHEAIGRLRERYSRVGRYYDISYDAATTKLVVREDHAKKASATRLDGAYILKTDRLDLSAEEAWRTYILLTRVETAFRDLKSPLAERPIFHHVARRVQAHIFLCLLAYHLLVAIEHTLLTVGVHTSWATIRATLESHVVNTIVLPLADGRVLSIRKGSEPTADQRAIYHALRMTEQIVKPIKTWHPDSHRSRTQIADSQGISAPV